MHLLAVKVKTQESSRFSCVCVCLGLSAIEKGMLVSAEDLGRAFKITRVLALCALVTSASMPSQEWLKER